MKISVCMPCFNAERWVAAALDSVLAQDHPNFEIIVVNDGSTDGSAAVLEQYAAQGVTVIERQNAGASASRNAAFRASSGDAVLFMDCDDLVPKNHLSSLAARLDGPHVIAMGQWDRFYEDPLEATFPSRATYRDATGPDWIVSGGWTMMQSAMFLVPRAHIDAHGAWDESLSLFDDFEFYTRIISRCERLHFVPEAKVYYRSGIVGSLSRNRSREKTESKLHSLLRGTGHLLGVDDSARTRRACAGVLQSFDYDEYPKHADLRAVARARVAELGGANVAPSGPPGFHKLRRWIGWRAARRVQHAAENYGLNGVARRTRRARN